MQILLAIWLAMITLYIRTIVHSLGYQNFKFSKKKKKKKGKRKKMQIYIIIVFVFKVKQFGL